MKSIISILIGLGVFALLPISITYAATVECSCVLGLRILQGINIHGDASRQKANVPTSDVQEGDVLIMKYPKDSHVALVTDVTEKEGQKFVTTDEYNLHRCQETIRTIALNDKHIVGVLRPNGSAKYSTTQIMV